MSGENKSQEPMFHYIRIEDMVPENDLLRLVDKYISEGCKVAVDMDVSKFFDTVHHDVLMHWVARTVRDKSLLRLIGKYLRAGVVVKARTHKTKDQGLVSIKEMWVSIHYPATAR